MCTVHKIGRVGSVTSQLERPAEAELIQQRREAGDSFMSRRQAAAKAGISPSQWSDIERGHKKAGAGITVPVQATAETLARMAAVVGASAEDLIAAGREDAARELRTAERERSLRKGLAAIPGIGSIGLQPLTGTGGEELLPIVAAALNAIEEGPLSPVTKRDLTGMFVDNLIHDAARRHAELLLVLRLLHDGGSRGQLAG
jgi:transcriptional regulator with XRE-family HTH domain